jgi:hypothetical protein
VKALQHSLQASIILHIVIVFRIRGFTDVLCPGPSVRRIKKLNKTNSVALVRERTIRPIDHRLLTKLVPPFAGRQCCMVSTTDPYGRILDSLDQSHYFFFQVAPQLYSQGWVGPVPDPLLLRKSGSARNRTQDIWICSQELRPLAQSGSQSQAIAKTKEKAVMLGDKSIYRTMSPEGTSLQNEIDG